MTGLAGLLFTSMSGAKSTLKPAAASSSPMTLPVASALSRAFEPVAPMAMLPVMRDPVARRETTPPSPSTHMR